MAARHTNKTLVAFAVSTVDKLADLQSWDFDVALDQEDGSGGLAGFEDNVVTKGSGKFSAEIMMNDTGVRATNLGISVWSIDGTSYLGDFESGSFSMTNGTIDGSGGADLWKVPQGGPLAACEVSGKLKITGTTKVHGIMSAAVSATVADKLMAMTITIAGETITCPMVLKSAKLSGSKGGFTYLDVSLSLGGTPTAPATGTLWSTAITGTSIITVFLDSGAGKVGTSASPLSCFISGLSFDWGMAGIIKSKLSLEIQGAPAYATS
jgi:hypothetical protein